MSVVVTATLIRTVGVVRFVTRSGIWVGRMASPIGSSAQFCCSKFIFSISDISCVSPTTVLFTTVFFGVWIHHPCVVAVSRVLRELIFVRNGSLGLSSDFIDVDTRIHGRGF